MKKTITSIAAVISFAICCFAVTTAYAAQPISDCTAELSSTSYTYNAKAHKPSVTVTTKDGEVLVKDEDYTISYKNNVNSGTAAAVITGRGDYSGSLEKEFSIARRSIGDSVKIANTKAYVGKTPSPVVTYGGKTLKKGTDYTVSISNNKKAGVKSATLKITGKGNFTSSKSYKVNVYPSKVSGFKTKNRKTTSFKLQWKSQESANVTGYKVYFCDKKGNNKDYCGTASSNYKNIKKLKSGKYYYFVVRAYKTSGNKTIYGDYSKVFKTCTKPSKVSLSSVTSSKSKKSITVKWKTTSSSGYQIQYTTDKKFKKGIKTVTVKGGSKKSKKISVKKGKTYYVRVRAFRRYNNNKKTVYGAWSSKLSSSYSHLYASFTTSYYSSNSNRCTNIATAAKYINGTVLQPGETFSFDKVVGKRTSAKGFKPAGVFTGSGHGVGIGGGICQVSTTMFNAALLGNLQIVERHQHSQKVSYVPYGRDAAMSWGTKNFQFKNNTKYPIKIKMITKNRQLTCALYVCQNVNPKKVTLKVSRKNGRYVLKRYVGGKCNYTTSSSY